jgi:hypothetical protein
MARARLALAFAAALGLALGSSAARADDPPPASTDGLFQKAAEALSRGEFGAAIDGFEALADQGFVHPDASYDRGLAYVARVRAKADKPGDLGRAAAAFEEALRLRPGDADADVALDLVRAEVTRRRSRRDKDVVDVRPTLDRMVVGLASEDAWGFAAIAASLLLAAGLVLRKRPAGPLHVAGSVLWPVAAVALSALVPLTWGARALRLGTRAGVVVVAEVALDDESGKPLGGVTIPEAAAVEVGDHRGALLRVRWGSSEGFVPASSVRLLEP